ncbi:MAG: hypothetical protein ACJ8G7_20330 [Rhizobacter sp.]
MALHRIFLSITVIGAVLALAACDPSGRETAANTADTTSASAAPSSSASGGAAKARP